VSSVSTVVESSRRRKLTYKEQRELEALPARIESLESEQAALNARMAGPEFYKEAPDAIRVALARADDLHREIAAAYERWYTLESLKSEV
jgi:ABC transport system ATP-binding/permease protein